jgi:cell division protein FtsW
MRFDREDKSLIADWWFTVDRVLLAAILVLMGVGVIVSLAASPAVADSKGLEAFYFVKRHVVIVLAGALLMVTLSLQTPRTIRRVALVTFLVSIAAMVYILVAGEAVNGARRWVRVMGMSLQPSELAKPAFIVLAAWAFAEWERRRDMPALPIAIALYAGFVGLLALQPDVGQSFLVTVVWAALFLLAGLSFVWVAALATLAVVGLLVAYVTLPYVAARIDVFLNADAAATSQVARAYESFRIGGLFGRGPGEGTIKTVLPDAHTDFIFAVIAEEYGVIACLALLALYGLIVFRALVLAIKAQDLSVRYAASGLALLIGLQALINMGVNVGLLPAKGMTLPFISAGGSSLIAVSLTFGMMLSLTRREGARLPDEAAHRVDIQQFDHGAYSK